MSIESPYNYVTESNEIIPVPRVSDVLSMIHEESLMNWAYNMGKAGKDFRQIQQTALDYGTEVHRRADIYFGDNAEEKAKLSELEEMLSFNALMDWANFYGTRLKPILRETSLSCSLYGGTFDLLAEIDGRIYLVDYKTSKFIGYKYLLQLAAYEFLIEYNMPALNMNINIDGIIILQLNKTTGKFQEYIYDLTNPYNKQKFYDYQTLFIDLAMSYNSIVDLKEEFNNSIKNIMMETKI